MLNSKNNLAASLLLTTILLSGCWQTDPGFRHELTDGYTPIYGSVDLQEITFSSPRLVRNPGKIYRYKNFLLVNEVQKGIHVYNNQDPGSPEPVGFINIFGNSDMAIKNDVLYADHAGNIVAIELNAFQDLEVKTSISLTNWNLGLPPPRFSNFQCVDPQKGIVIQWKKVQQQNLECYAF